MSIHYMNAVWRDPYFTNSDKTKLLVALALADCSDDNGQSFPSIDYIAKKARSTTRCAQMACREMERDGKLEILIGMGRNGTNLYRLKAEGETNSGMKCADKGIDKGIANPFHPNHKEAHESSGNTPPTATKVAGSDQLLCDFDAFWKEYPRKRAKDDAVKAWKKHKPDIQAVLNKIREFKQSHEWTREGGRFIPYPASWLNSMGWEDELRIDLSVTRTEQQPAQPIDKRSDLEKHLDYWNAADALGKKPVDFGAWLRAGKPEN